MKIMKTIISVLALCVMNQFVNAQWTSKASNFFQPQKGFSEMIAVNSLVAWGLAYERNYAFVNPLTDFTRTIDGGNTWIAGNISSMPDQFVVGMEPESDVSAYFLTADANFTGKILKTTDGGITWTQLNVAPYTLFFDNIHFFNANDGVVVAELNKNSSNSTPHLIVFTTSDGGTTWTCVPKANLPSYGNAEKFYSWSMCAVGNTMWTVTTKAKIWKSVDKGLHWASYNTPDNKAIVSQIKMRDALHGLWGVGGDLYRTIDGGITWTEIHPTGTYFTFDLAYVPGTISTYISTGGDTANPWQVSPGALHGIGSSYSPDDGNTWITIDTAVDHLAIDMVNTTTGFCGGFNTTSSNGVFKYTGPAFNPRLSTDKIFSDFSLSVFPNPISNSTTVAFSLSKSQKISLKIFDLNGRLIATLTDRIFEEGDNEFMWNATEANAGVYFLKFQSEENIQTEKLIVTK